MRLRRILVWSGCFAAVVTLTAATESAPVRIQSIDGRTLKPFEPVGAASIVFFVATDCPVSNSYAPEIQRICREYGPRGVECSLMYEDFEAAGTRLDDGVRRHLHEYRYADVPAAVDRSRTIANASLTSGTARFDSVLT